MPLLLPTDKIARKPTTTEIVAELGVWGLTGAIVHSVAQGIQQKPVFASKFLFTRTTFARSLGSSICRNWIWSSTI